MWDFKNIIFQYKYVCPLHMFICALWGSETRLEYNLQTYIATEAFAAIIILGFMCKRVIDSFLKKFYKRVIDLFRAGEMSAKCLVFVY